MNELVAQYRSEGVRYGDIKSEVSEAIFEELGPLQERRKELENNPGYVGINAPETVDPRRKVECFGREASDFNAGLVEGKRVRLEKDISETDRYGRLLRFVYLEDGGFVNEILVREGNSPPGIAAIW
jgi:hypothetical protein